MIWSGFFYLCEACQRPMVAQSALAHGWCDHCYVAQLESPFSVSAWLPYRTQPARSTTEVVAAYRYTGLLRQIIRRAKLDGEWRALNTLRELAKTGAPRMTDLIHNPPDFCLPVASSLRGRLQGRVDVAGVLARDLARQFGCRLMQPPWFEWWEWQRRSSVAARQWPTTFEPKRQSNRQTRQTSPDLCGRRILIVDDIATSGFSLSRTAQAIDPGGRASFYFFALAAGRSMYRESMNPSMATMTTTPVSSGESGSLV